MDPLSLPLTTGRTARVPVARGGQGRHAESSMPDRPKPWSFSSRKAEVPSHEKLARPQGPVSGTVSGKRAPEEPPASPVSPASPRGTKPRATSGEVRRPTGAKRPRRPSGGHRLPENTVVALIGSLDRVPTLAIEPARLTSLSVDHRAGFLLSQVDGRSMTLEMIVDVSGMPRVEALRLLLQLLEQGILRVD